MPLTSAEALEDLQTYVAARGFTMSPALLNVFDWIERFSESAGSDPYPNFFLLGMLRNSLEFRDIVTNLGGDPDTGADFIEEDIETGINEYGDTDLYSAADYRTSDRPAMIDYTIRSAHMDGR